MKLILDISQKDDELVSSKEYTFYSSSGIIGRDMGCDLYLEDLNNYISSRHAKIEYKDNNYYITDISTNGTYFKETNQRLQKNIPINIKNGDIFVIGKYDLKVKFIKDDYINYEISKDIHINDVPNFQEIISDDFLFSNDISEDKIVSNNSSDNIDIMNIITDEFKNEDNEEFFELESIGSSIQHHHTSLEVYNDKKEIFFERNLELINILEDEFNIELSHLEFEEQKIAVRELASILKISLSLLKGSLNTKNEIEKEIVKQDGKFVIINPILEEENILKILFQQGDKKMNFDIKEEIKNSFDELNNYCIALHKTNKELANILKIKDSSFEEEYKNSFTSNLDSEKII